MRYLPIAIDSKDKLVTILGGGESSLIKTRTFLRGLFTIRVVALDFLEDFYTLEKTYPKLSLIKKEIIDDFSSLKADYLVLASADVNLHTRILAWARPLKIPVLDTIDPKRSDFILNKIIEKDRISLSISTDGRGPFLAKYLAGEFEKSLKTLDFEKIELLLDLRSLLKKKNMDIKAHMETVLAKSKDELEEYIKDLTDDKDRN
ncbi:MAG: NAD(P)-dependent oxidoreductase [Anaerococcus sp.]|nr:NAD(P)-dependent oxidoreductase [Anaerococcus sp.]